jgi:aminoglycoside/choline kinase family phosphotransferase
MQRDQFVLRDFDEAELIMRRDCANAALIGDELVQFQNAQLIGEKSYKLTRLLGPPRDGMGD